MNTRIKTLDQGVINQIAAGEVVSDPAAIVKELVENAVDAGADQIRITFRSGGKSLIVVSDNGDGMTAGDLPLSVQRHATSKIFSASDLRNVRTFGFRGEALASIDLAADLRIRSGRDGEAYQVEDENLSPAPFVQGTTVWVENLFRKIPARQKFLRSDLSEKIALRTVVQNAALAHPEIGFRLEEVSGNGAEKSEVLLGCFPESLDERMRSVLGDGITSGAVPLNERSDRIKMTGAILVPTRNVSVSERRVFVNGRPIRSQEILSAARSVLDAYPHMKGAGFLLMIEIDPENVDVNAHPRKSEVRFRDLGEVLRDVSEGVRAAILRTNKAIRTDAEISTSDDQEQKPILDTFRIGPWVLVRKEGDILGCCASDVIRRRMRTSPAEDLPEPLLIGSVSELNLNEMAAHGFEAEPFGGGSHVLTRIPSGTRADPKRLPNLVGKSVRAMDLLTEWAARGVGDDEIFAWATPEEVSTVDVKKFERMMKRG